MRSETVALLLILVANVLVVALYLLYGLVVRPAARGVRRRRVDVRRATLVERLRESARDAEAHTDGAETPTAQGDGVGSTSSHPASARSGGVGGAAFQTRVLQVEISDEADASPGAPGGAGDAVRVPSEPASASAGAEAGAKKAADGYSRAQYLLHAGVMLLLPVAGACYFGLGYLFRRVFFRRHVDVSDVIFSKQRTFADERADVDREINVAPLGEAVAVTDDRDLRRLVLDVMRGDSHVSMKSISEVIRSDDSESSHYAASILSDSLNRFRMESRRLLNTIREDAKGSSRLAEAAIAQEGDAGMAEQQEHARLLLARECERYIDMVDDVLRQHVFTDLEQRQWTGDLAEVGEVMWESCRPEFDVDRMAGVCSRLIEIDDFERARTWCARLRAQFPDNLTSYTVQLHLSYEMGDGEAFHRTLSELESSSVVIDNRTLDVIRLFGSKAVA